MIFGKANTSYVPYNYTSIFAHLNLDQTTAWNHAGNYILGCTMIVSFVVSLCCNPVVFYFNYQQKNTKLKLTRILFMMLAVSDFLGNIYQPISVAQHALTPEVLHIMKPATRFEQAQTLQVQWFGYSSMLITALIAACRFVNVKYPFYNIPTAAVLAFYAAGQLIAMATTFELVVGFTDSAERFERNAVFWYLYCQSAYSHSISAYDSTFVYPKSAILSLLSGAGAAFSVLTVVTLIHQNPIKKESVRATKRNSQENEANKILMTKEESQAAKKKKRENHALERQKKILRCSYAIMIMNIGSVLAVVVMFMYGYYGTHIPATNVLGSCGMFIILSALNPLARIVFSTEIKQLVRDRKTRFTTTISTSMSNFGVYG